MDLEKLESKVKLMLTEHGFRLMRLGFVVEDKEKYFRVIVDKYHHKIGLDEIVMLSEKIDKFIDEDASDDHFILDVTTTGAEKEIPIAEINDYLDLAINVELKDGTKGAQNYVGTLCALDESSLTLKINAKGRISERVLALADIKLIRRAIKL